MTGLRVLWSRLRDSLFSRTRDTRLDEEIRTHLELLTDEYVARGLSRTDAARAARRAFGGVDQTRAVFRDQRGLPLVETVAQDIRFALRLLRRDRGFTLTALLVLALGIGVNNMLFAILNAHTLRGLPIRDAKRVASISTLDDRNRDRGLSYPELEDLRGAVTSFAGVVAVAQLPTVISGDGRAAERLDGLFVSGDAFAVVGGRAVLGRGFAPEDERPGAAPVAMIGSWTWQSRYGSDPEVLGRSILVNGAPSTIVGVVGDRSGFPTTAELWVPLSHLPDAAARQRTDRVLRPFGRLRDGATLDDAAAEVQVLAERLARSHPESNGNIRMRVIPINERYFGRWDDPVWLAFMTAGVLVVLISAANVANLMLGRAARRTREIAIRSSLGASRARLVRQLLIEGSVLAVVGGALGLGLALAGIALFRSAIPENALPYWFDYSPDARVIAALVLVSVATIFVFALLPAVQASRADLNRVTKDAGRGTSGSRAARRWSTAFLTAEFALAVVLLAQTAMSIRGRRPPLPSDDAIGARQVLTASVTLSGERYRTPQQRLDFYRLLNERLRAVPEVSSMAVAGVAPLMGGSDAGIDIAGRPPADPAAPRTAKIVAVGPRYFETLALPLVRGRELLDSDGAGDHPSAVVVNQEFARQVLGEADPIGQRVALRGMSAPAGAPRWSTVVGLSLDIRQRPGADPEPVVYVAYAADPAPTATLLVRSRSDAGSLAARLKDEVAALDANLPLDRVRTMAEVIWNARWNARLSYRLILTLTLIAVGLSTVGLYAVTMHAVSQRTQEIGVRMALGARPRQVVAMIVRGALVQLGFGFAAGIVCTRLWTGLLPSGSPDVSITDPGSLALVAAVLAVASVLACVAPARRATRLDPVAAIRHE